MAGKQAETEIKKKAAKALYLMGLQSQADICIGVGVAAKTMSKWVTDGHWEDERNKELLREDQTVENIRRIIASQSQILADLGDELAKEGKLLTAGQLDGFAKTFKLLQKDSLSMDAIVRICKNLLSYISTEDIDVAKKVQPMVSRFIALQQQQQG